jgi:hypothetical protein
MSEAGIPEHLYEIAGGGTHPADASYEPPAAEDLPVGETTDTAGGVLNTVSGSMVQIDSLAPWCRSTRRTT